MSLSREASRTGALRSAATLPRKVRCSLRERVVASPAHGRFPHGTQLGRIHMKLKMYPLALLALGTMACAGGEPAAKGDPVAGEAVYTASCLACHGAGGTGEAESGVTGASDLTVMTGSLTDDEIATIVLEGSGSMLSIPLDDDSLDDLIAYLRATFEGGGDTD